MSIEVKNKARVLDNYYYFWKSRNCGSRFGSSGWGWVDNEMRIKVNIQTWTYHTNLRDLYMGSVNIALIRDVGSARGVRMWVAEAWWKTQQGNVYMNKEHRKAGLERNKRQDFTIDSVQGRKLLTTEFKCGNLVPEILEVVSRWQGWLLESGMDQNLSAIASWVLQDITQAQGMSWSQCLKPLWTPNFWLSSAVH